MIRGATLLKTECTYSIGYLDQVQPFSGDTLGSDNGALSVKAYSLLL